MKKIFTIISIACASLVAMNANAQDGGSDAISNLFKGNKDDVNKLTNAYTSSLFKGFGNSLNGGWTNTAKTQKFLRFAIRISASASIIPETDKTYDVTQLGLSSNIKPTDASKTIAPTFGGSTNAGPSITISDPNHPNNPNYTYKTNLPAGVSQYVPAPQVQLTVGVSHNTDVSLRYIPTTKISDNVGSVGMFGFGIKHNFAQDFSTLTHPVPFDLALAFGYNRLNYNLPLSVKPDAGSSVSGNSDFSNQSLDGHFTGVNVQAILSKKLLFFTPFVAVGYSESKTDVTTLGNYPFITGVTATGQPSYTSYANPISITQANISGLRADVGFQLSLTFLKIYGSYSFAEYKSANVGIGLGF